MDTTTTVVATETIHISGKNSKEQVDNKIKEIKSKLMKEAIQRATTLTVEEGHHYDVNVKIEKRLLSEQILIIKAIAFVRKCRDKDVWI